MNSAPVHFVVGRYNRLLQAKAVIDHELGVGIEEKQSMQRPTRKTVALRILLVGLLLTALRLAYVITRQISACDHKTANGPNGGSFYSNFNILPNDKQYHLGTKIEPRENDAGKCSLARRRIIEGAAEDLLEEEPAKPWIALKKNLNNVRYLPSILEHMEGYRNYVYIDVGARNYASSIGSWFERRYPKGNRTFDVYAIEADPLFHAEYRKRKGVRLLPYAAWLGNATLSMERSGIGRIVASNNNNNNNNKSKEVVEVQGFDFAEWVKGKFGSAENYVVMKMDVEGLEFHLVDRMVERGAICAVDELFLECHYNRWQRCCPHKRTPKYTKTYSQCLSLFKSLRARGILAHQWW